MKNFLIAESRKTGGPSHHYKMFIARTHKLVLSTFFFNCVAPLWNALPNTCFAVERMSVFKYKLRNVDLKQFCKGH